MIRPIIGGLALCLLASCGGGGSGSSSGGGTPTPTNRAPVANAGADISRSLSPNAISLDGSQSSDPDGNTLSYSWEITIQPNGGNGTLQNSTLVNPGFSASVPGDYRVRLTVRDSGGLTSTDTVNLSLSNDPPIISIDPYEQAVLVNDNLAFNASGSSDPNGHSLTFSWQLKSAPTGATTPSLFSGSAIDTTFDVSGEYVLELTVSDGYTQTIQQLDPLTALSFIGREFNNPITAAEYSAQAGRLVILHGTTVSIIADDGATSEVTLGESGTVLAINNQGTLAAVGSQNDVTIIDLSAGQIERTYRLTGETSGLMLAGSDYLYRISDTGTGGRINGLDLNSQSQGSITSERVQSGSIGSVHPDDLRLYVSDPSGIERSITRFGTSDGQIVDQIDTELLYANTHSFCAGVWFSEDGRALLDSCGAIVYLDEDVNHDLFFSHRLGNRFSFVQSAAHSSATDSWYVVSSNTAVGSDHIEIYDLDTGEQKQSLEFTDVNDHYGHRLAARYVFVNPTTGRLIVIASTELDTANAHMLLEGLLPQPNAQEQAPVALVQSYRSAHVNTNAELDAGRSYDPNDDALTFSWSLTSQPAGSSLTLGDTSQPQLNVTPDVVGEYKLAVTVSDGSLTESANVTLNVFGSNQDLVQQLSGRMTDFAYSDVANVGAYITESDDTLRIVDFDTLAETIIPIKPFAGKVTISPDGSHIAVSHTGRVTLIRVSTGQIVEELENRTEWGDIVLQNSLVAHQVAHRPEFSRLRSLDFNSMTVTEGTGALNDVTMRLHPNGNWLYGVTDFTGLIEMAKWDLSNIPTSIFYIKPIDGGVGGEENQWFTESGNHFLTGSGQLFTSTSDRTTDIEDTNIDLAGGVFARWASHSSQLGSWVVTEGNRLEHRILIFEDAGLTQTGQVPTLDIMSGANALTSVGVQAHFSGTGQQIIAVTQAESDPAIYAVQITDTP